MKIFEIRGQLVISEFKLSLTQNSLGAIQVKETWVHPQLGTIIITYLRDFDSLSALYVYGPYVPNNIHDPVEACWDTLIQEMWHARNNNSNT